MEAISLIRDCAKYVDEKPHVSIYNDLIFNQCSYVCMFVCCIISKYRYVKKIGYVDSDNDWILDKINCTSLYNT